MCMVFNKSYGYSFIFHFISHIILIDKPLLLLRGSGGDNKCVVMHALSITERNFVELSGCVVPAQRLEPEFRKREDIME